MQRSRILLIPLVLTLALFVGTVQISYAQEQTTQLTATVRRGGNIRATPSLKGTVVAHVKFKETLTVIEKTANGGWYHIVAPEAEGWVSVVLLTMPRTLASQVPVQGTTPVFQVPGAATVTVFNGGNVRDNHGPTGVVIDQINAGETVQVIAKCNKDIWIEIVDVRGKVGWVHKTLLNIDQSLIDKLPVD